MKEAGTRVYVCLLPSIEKASSRTYEGTTRGFSDRRHINLVDRYAPLLGVMALHMTEPPIGR